MSQVNAAHAPFAKRPQNSVSPQLLGSNRRRRFRQRTKMRVGQLLTCRRFQQASGVRLEHLLDHVGELWVVALHAFKVGPLACP